MGAYACNQKSPPGGWGTSSENGNGRKDTWIKAGGSNRAWKVPCSIALEQVNDPKGMGSTAGRLGGGLKGPWVFIEWVL